MEKIRINSYQSHIKRSSNDQLLPGELRYNLIGDSLVGVIHKKPKVDRFIRWSGRLKATGWLKAVTFNTCIHQMPSAFKNKVYILYPHTPNHQQRMGIITEVLFTILGFEQRASFTKILTVLTCDSSCFCRMVAFLQWVAPVLRTPSMALRSCESLPVKSWVFMCSFGELWGLGWNRRSTFKPHKSRSLCLQVWLRTSWRRLGRESMEDDGSLDIGKMKHNLNAFSLKTLPDLALLWLPAKHACISHVFFVLTKTLWDTKTHLPKHVNLAWCMAQDLPNVMPALDLAAEPIPLWWTTDFINASPPGTEAKDEKWSLGTCFPILHGMGCTKMDKHGPFGWLDRWKVVIIFQHCCCQVLKNLGFLPSKLKTFGVLRIVGEFNCSCVGISRCLAAYCKDDTPNASWDAPWLKEIHVVRGWGICLDIGCIIATSI